MHITEPRVIVGTPAERPVGLAFSLGDRNVIDAGEALLHQIRRWWSKKGWEDCNIAILTGTESDIVVLDIDKHVRDLGRRELRRSLPQVQLEP